MRLCRSPPMLHRPVGHFAARNLWQWSSTVELQPQPLDQEFERPPARLPLGRIRFRPLPKLESTDGIFRYQVAILEILDPSSSSWMACAQSISAKRECHSCQSV